MTPTQTILQPEEINPAISLANRILAQLDRILLGRSELHRLVLTGIFSRGHILLEGLPGVGKTALVKALGDLLGLEFKRVQFTPDLMPSDILGTHILQSNPDGRREMEFHARADLSPICCWRMKSTAPRRRRNPPCWKPCRNTR